MIEHKSNKLDILGMSASLVCAVHCLAIPLVFTLGSAYMAELLHHPVIEVGFLLIAVVIAVWSLGTSFLNHHHNRRPLVLGIIGVILITLGVVVHAWFITLPGGLVLAWAHFLNFKLLRSCGCSVKMAA
ncbi:MAG: MerC domain-containing protein [Saprospirales bacterium]|nr:MAG: MerC domain-containing protein [Saprospirales bacterium]